MRAAGGPCAAQVLVHLVTRREQANEPFEHTFRFPRLSGLQRVNASRELLHVVDIVRDLRLRIRAGG